MISDAEVLCMINLDQVTFRVYVGETELRAEVFDGNRLVSIRPGHDAITVLTRCISRL
jgi:hypothetical protein